MTTCPTCGSDDPAICADVLPSLSHKHIGRAYGQNGCCPDPFHSPEAEQGIDPWDADEKIARSMLEAEVERLREQLEEQKRINAFDIAVPMAELREQLEQERAKRKAHAKASLNQQLERNRYREALELAERWFRNFERRPAHEGIDVSGADTTLRKIDTALDPPEES